MHTGNSNRERFDEITLELKDATVENILEMLNKSIAFQIMLCSEKDAYYYIACYYAIYHKTKNAHCAKHFLEATDDEKKDPRTFFRCYCFYAHAEALLDKNKDVFENVFDFEQIAIDEQTPNKLIKRILEAIINHSKTKPPCN